MPVKDLVERLIREKLTIATAESCSGGLVAAAITSVPGSSDCFSYGLVTYSNEAKERLLQVPPEILATYSTVSSETAAAMTEGLLALAGADLAVSVTGIAGPEGGSAEKPVGLVYIGLAGKAGLIYVKECRFSGSRDEIRNKIVMEVIILVGKYLEGANNVI